MGIDISPYELGHLACRDQYVHLRTLLERHVEGWVPQRLVTATGPNPPPH